MGIIINPLIKYFERERSQFEENQKSLGKIAEKWQYFFNCLDNQMIKWSPPIVTRVSYDAEVNFKLTYYYDQTTFTVIHKNNWWHVKAVHIQGVEFYDHVTDSAEAAGLMYRWAQVVIKLSKGKNELWNEL